MSTIEDVRRKIKVNPVYPSDTRYPYGLTEEENNLLSYPFPPLAECSVAISPSGSTAISRKPTGKPWVVEVPASLIAGPTLRERGLTLDQVQLIVVDM